MKTSIQEAIDDINGYRTFSDKIDIKFVCSLLKHVYLEKEKKQMLEMWQGGINSCDSENPSFDKYYNEKYNK
jgi:hypothetical protein